MHAWKTLSRVPVEYLHSYTVAPCCFKLCTTYHVRPCIPGGALELYADHDDRASDFHIAYYCIARYSGTYHCWLHSPSGQEKLDAMRLKVGTRRVQRRCPKRVHQVHVGSGAQEFGDDGLVTKK